MKMDKGKAVIWKTIDEMHEKMKDHDPEKIGRLIDEAVEEARKLRPMRKVRKSGA